MNKLYAPRRKYSGILRNETDFFEMSIFPNIKGTTLIFFNTITSGIIG